jgi:hypothetical protein
MALDILLRSLMMQWRRSTLHDRILVHAYIVDTDITDDLSDRQQQLQGVVDGVNAALLLMSSPAGVRRWLDPRNSSQAVMFRAENSVRRKKKNFMYGYDDSEDVLNYFKQQVNILVLDIFFHVHIR